jgi:hypothetical protein
MKILDYTNVRGIPVWTGKNLLEFLKAKDGARFTDISWSDHLLSFKLISSVHHSNDLTVMIPANYGNKKVKGISLDGTIYPYTIRKIKGYEYALLRVRPGQDHQIDADYR